MGKNKIIVDYIEIAKIKPNPKNPRVIKDEKYRQLCDSLRNFPEMLEKRPLVCFTDIDGKFTVLGGNMRLKAAIELGMKELPVMLADTWTQEQKAEFLIKDNVGFGEWNWEELQADWNVEQLDEWGLDIPAGIAVAESGDPFDDGGIGAKNQYGVIVMCASEEEQEHIFTRLTGEGFNCKVVVT